MPRTSPSELTISLTTSPQPPRRFTSRRKAVSVMPAIGASANGSASVTFPTRTFRTSPTSRTLLVRSHIRRIDFDADRLADEIHRQHQTRVRSLAHQPPDHPLQRTVRHFHHHPLTDQGTRIELQVALDQPPDAVDLVLGDGNDLAVERHDADHAGAGQDRKTLRRMNARETVARKERPVDLLLAILPAAPAGDRGKERFEPLAFELLPDGLLVPRARPDGVPRRGILHTVSPRLTLRRSCRWRSAVRRPSATRRSSTR